MVGMEDNGSFDDDEEDLEDVVGEEDWKMIKREVDSEGGPGSERSSNEE